MKRWVVRLTVTASVVHLFAHVGCATMVGAAALR